ncbi:hypothetical protein [Candidatus Nucleicultrix amoebiphila]|uniref:Uncharacterized protein n=1 Tax=Candidatus Nucleicultrix amoebiphila FS5 TaxID=1414854 RepID=A0A1W6N4S5_9PROT|nr:hypothetical protein [Candidatus Nucleicultrix amoebiphila]ARN84768.1 hypothetical protein GQ61_05065 [Candidatus Nucleicultrix amoebiphila FS5]
MNSLSSNRNIKKSIASCALLLGLMFEAETLLNLNLLKLKKKKNLMDLDPMFQAEVLAALSSIKSFGRLLQFLSEELQQVLDQELNDQTNPNPKILTLRTQ